MWYIFSINIVNLFSHEDTYYEVKRGAMAMFIGDNGAGKSTVNEAITLAISGEVSRKVGKDEFIREGEEYAEVYLVMKNDVLNEQMEISRVVSRKSSAKLSVKINGEPVIKSGITPMQEFIWEQLGITQDDYENYYVIGQGNRNSFFTAGDAKQKEVIARFGNFTPIDLVLATIKKEISALSQQQAQKAGAMMKATGSLETLEEELIAVEENFESDKRQRIQEEQANMERLRKSINDTHAKIEDAEAKVKAKQAQAAKIKPKDPTKLKAKLEELKVEKREGRAERDEANTTISQLKTQQGEAVKCPYCKKEFIPASELTPVEIAEGIAQLRQGVKEYEVYLNELQIKIDVVDSAIADIIEDKAKTVLLQNEIDSLVEIKGEYQVQIGSYNKKLTQISARIEEINRQSISSRVTELQAKIEDYKEQIEAIANDQLNLINTIEEKQFFEFHFGNKGFKSFLAKKAIKNIQDIVNWYLNKFDINLQVYISGYTTTKQNEVRDKIEVSIVRDGMSKGLFKKYSGGEQNRVDLCGILGINRLINNTCEYGKGLDFLVIDENVSYLDSKGQEEIVNILAKAGVTCILVMHNVAALPYENKVWFTKENGVTTIYENTGN